MWDSLLKVGVNVIKIAFLKDYNYPHFKVQIFNVFRANSSVDSFLLKKEAEQVKKLLEELNYTGQEYTISDDDTTYLTVTEANYIIRKKLYKIKNYPEEGEKRMYY